MNPTRTILHADMDAFFAAVEVLDNPELKGKPIIVGGTPEGRGVVSAASYEARAFGVHSAQPSATAVKLCPHGVFLPVRGRRYAEISRRVMTILRSFTPLVEPISIDEAFLDVSGSARLFGNGEQIARAIKTRVHGEIGLTCSLGVAPNKFLAKLASDLNKPDGLTVIPPGREAETIAPLSVTRIWGVGPRTAERLEAMDIHTIGELAAAASAALENRLGDRATHLQALARGEDERVVTPVHEAKSISRETTFATFLSDKEYIETKLLALAEDVAMRLRAAGRMTRTVSIRVRDETFHTVTRARTLRAATDLGEDIHAVAVRLFREHVDLGGRKVRLLGVSAENLTGPEGRQLDLFTTERTEKGRDVAGVMDEINRKYGSGTVQKARLVQDGQLSDRAGWEGVREQRRDR